MSEISALDQIVNEVRAAAKEIGALVIESALAGDRDTFPSASVEAADFPALIRHLRPRLVYLVSAEFDAGDDLLDAVEEEDESLLELPAVKTVVSKWRARDGQTSRVALAVMSDGVIHDIVEDADWLAEFESEAEDLMEEIEKALEARDHG
ncbi:MAG: hypothetical protein ABSA13_06225 [Beijerinckiaceae bacterium]